MTPHETVQAQILHQETEAVPYTLAFEPEVETRLDDHYGGVGWRDRITPFIVKSGKIAVPENEILDDTHIRDAFGTVWRTDRLPKYAVEPGLKVPTFDGYDFPSLSSILNPDGKTEAKKTTAEFPDSFTVISTGLCLWQSWYVRGFENTMMDCIAEEDFYAELLDRMTELTLAVIRECEDIPADALFLGDDWGNQRGVMIGPERFVIFF